MHVTIVHHSLISPQACPTQPSLTFKSLNITNSESQSQIRSSVTLPGRTENEEEGAALLTGTLLDDGPAPPAVPALLGGALAWAAWFLRTRLEGNKGLF